VDIRKGEQGCRLGAPFFQRCRGDPMETFALVFALFCLKADEPLWSRKLWSKSYVFQNKAEICAKEGPLTTLMCRQRTM